MTIVYSLKQRMSNNYSFRKFVFNELTFRVDDSYGHQETEDKKLVHHTYTKID